MQNDGADYDMRVFGPEDVDLITQFNDGFHVAFDSSPQVFFNLTDEQLAAPGSRFAVALHRGRVVAGARAVIEGTPAVYVGQCYTERPHRGRRLIGRAVASLRDSFACSHGVARARLVVRMINGEANPAVISAYSKVGFVADGVISRKIDPEDDMSRHLLETADAGGILSVLSMTASPDTLEENRVMLRAFGLQLA